jgi:hypothetical protein
MHFPLFTTLIDTSQAVNVTYGQEIDLSCVVCNTCKNKTNRSSFFDSLAIQNEYLYFWLNGIFKFAWHFTSANTRKQGQCKQINFLKLGYSAENFVVTLDSKTWLIFWGFRKISKSDY